MSIFRELGNAKTLLDQGMQLFGLRLKLLRLDVEDQIAGILMIIALICLASVLLLGGLIALFIGLMIVLPEQARIWVFFSLAAIGLITALILALRIPVIWKRNTQQISQTMQDMQGDFQRFRQAMPSVPPKE